MRVSGKHDNEISDYEEDGQILESLNDCISSRRILLLED
jgi:hypothetical protein